MINSKTIIIVFVQLVFFSISAHSQEKIFGTYVSSTWSCCFSCNCATKYVLTVKKDSSYVLEEYKYTSPIKGKWWRYTLDSYEMEYRNWRVNGDTIITKENLFGFPILIKNGLLMTSGDARLFATNPEWFNTNKQIKQRQFKRKRLGFLYKHKIKKHIRHRD